MEDRRRQERERVGFHAEVTRAGSEEVVGHLCDISPSGIMLLGQSPFQVGQVLLLDIEAPGAAGGPVRVRAIVRWSEPDLDGSLHAAGLELVEPDVRTLAGIQRLRRLL